MERREINPWPWSVEMGFHQAVEVSAGTRTLYCSGQTSVDENGGRRCTPATWWRR